MGFVWDVVKGLTKMAVNIHTVGAFDTPIFEDDESDGRIKSETRSDSSGQPPIMDDDAALNAAASRLLIRLKPAAAATCDWVAQLRDKTSLTDFELSLSLCVFCMLLEWSIAPAGKEQSNFWGNSDDKSKIANAVFYEALANCPEAVLEIRRKVSSFDPLAEAAMAHGFVSERERARWNPCLTRTTLLGTKALAGSVAVHLGVRSPLGHEDYSFGEIALTVPFPLILRSSGGWLMEHLSEPCVAFLIGIQMP